MSEQEKKDQHRDAPVKPEPETLHTTDPQKNMEGPISSFMNNLKEGVDEEGRKIDPDPESKDEKK